MMYIENNLSCAVYCSLRESVGWANFPKEQMEKALSSSVYTVVAFEDQQPVGMGRLIGDGIYYAIVDVAVHPAYQNRGIGKKHRSYACAVCRYNNACRKPFQCPVDF